MPGRKKKSPGEDLEVKLKETLENMKDDELRKKASEVALLRQAQVEAMKNDEDVKQKRAELTFLVKDRYKDDIKGADDQLGYIMHLLESRGKL